MARGNKNNKRKRLNAIATEETEHTAEVTNPILTKPNADLFVLDSRPDEKVLKHETSVVRSVEKKVEKKAKRNGMSEKEARKVNKMLSSNTADQLIRIAAEGKKRQKTPFKENTNFDVWDDSNVISSDKKDKIITQTRVASSQGGISPMILISESESKKNGILAHKTLMTHKQASNSKKPKAIAVEPAKPGQSYRPDREHHQDAIGEALAVEIRRKEATDYITKPISDGMSAETLALLRTDDDSSSSDDDSDDEMEDATERPSHRTKYEQKTRAKRNKQKRVKARQVALIDTKRKKQFLNSLQTVKKLSKQLKKEEITRKEQKDSLETLKKEQQAQNPPGANLWEKLISRDPLRVPALPVALTKELKGGSLRTMIPKQNELMKERVESMADRKMVSRKKLMKKNVVAGKKRKSGKNREVLLF